MNDKKRWKFSTWINLQNKLIFLIIYLFICIVSHRNIEYRTDPGSELRPMLIPQTTNNNNSYQMNQKYQRIYSVQCTVARWWLEIPSTLFNVLSLGAYCILYWKMHTPTAFRLPYMFDAHCTYRFVYFNCKSCYISFAKANIA